MKLLAVFFAIVFSGCASNTNNVNSRMVMLRQACDNGQQSACIDYANGLAAQREAWSDLSAQLRQTQSNINAQMYAPRVGWPYSQ